MNNEVVNNNVLPKTKLTLITFYNSFMERCCETIILFFSSITLLLEQHILIANIFRFQSKKILCSIIDYNDGQQWFQQKVAIAL